MDFSSIDFSNPIVLIFAIALVVGIILFKRYLNSKGVETPVVDELTTQFATSGSVWMSNLLSSLQKGKTADVNAKVAELQKSNNIEKTFDDQVAIPLAKQAVLNAANSGDHKTLADLQESLDVAKAKVTATATAALTSTTATAKTA